MKGYPHLSLSARPGLFPASQMFLEALLYIKEDSHCAMTVACNKSTSCRHLQFASGQLAGAHTWLEKGLQ